MTYVKIKINDNEWLSVPSTTISIQDGVVYCFDNEKLVVIVPLKNIQMCWLDDEHIADHLERRNRKCQEIGNK